MKGPIVGTMIFFFVIQFVDNMLEQAHADGTSCPSGSVDQNNFSVRCKYIVAGAGARRCSWCSGRRASSATGGSRSSMSADAGGAPTVPDARDRPTIEPVPGVAKPDPILVADGVRRRFGGLVAVDVDHVEVQRNQITALIGPNGAGKTTFFNLLTGFDEPDGGTWTFDGERRRRHGRRTRSPGWAWSARSS